MGELSRLRGLYRGAYIEEAYIEEGLISERLLSGRGLYRWGYNWNITFVTQ